MAANNKQIGGDHYIRGGEYQHWDFVCDIKLHYLPATATKYISRYRFKDRYNEDLEKSLHYIDKAEEIGLQGNPDPHRMAAFWRFVLANSLTMPEAIVCWYCMEGEWAAARLAIQGLLYQTS